MSQLWGIMGYDTCFTWTHLKGLVQSKIQSCVIDKGKNEDMIKLRYWTSKHCSCNNTTTDHSYNWCMHDEECVNISPLISSIVRHANELWLSPNFTRLCWLSAILQTCQMPHFWRDCPTFWACKIKKEGQSYFLDISVMANFTEWTTENDVNFTWNFYFSIFTSLLW